MSQNDISAADLDRLSQAARNVLKMNVATAYTRLVVSGDGNEEARPALEMLSPDRVLSSPAKNLNEAGAALSGLWLWHDWLHEAHTLAQSLETASGSMWHAIMHRREGDFSNSKYWYARCGNHPIFPSLAARASDLINPFPADKAALRLVSNGWNPDAMVDLVEAVHDRPNDPRYALAVALQQLEWRALFDECVRRAG
jgi:hypothetical protein